MAGEAIVVDGLAHRYGRRAVHDGLSFVVESGRVFGLLGKNGVGKTTLINLLMGFLRPEAGTCRILGEPSHALRPETRRRIGLLFEGHLAYEFMTIEQTERFHASFHPRWKRELFYDLVGRLRLPPTHKIGQMSEGQRSQVVLGLLFAQDPDLMILDDYSLGLDAGYRRLFLEYLADYVASGERTVFITSHIVQGLEELLDEVLFLRPGRPAHQAGLKEFMAGFRRYRLRRRAGEKPPEAAGVIENVEELPAAWDVYAFAGWEAVRAELARQGCRVGPEAADDVRAERPEETEAILAGSSLPVSSMTPPASWPMTLPMTLEDAFVGFTGRY